MDRDYSHGLSRLARGAAAGFAGTLATQVLMTVDQKWLPGAAPPIRQGPGEFMVEVAEAALPAAVSERIPDVVESGAAKLPAHGYGLTFGALYAACRSDDGVPLLRDGIALGVANSATGYVGWLPALGLIPPVWQQQPRQVVVPLLNQTAKDWHTRVVTLSETKGLSERFFAALRMTRPMSRSVKCTNVLWFDLEHAVYGITTVAAYNWLQESVPEPRPARHKGGG